MIKRPRHLVSEPSSLQSVIATREYNAALNHYASGTTEPYGKFKIYKSPDVKKQLEELFFVKCAYCESNYKTSGQINVEHFRPKGEVKLENGQTFTPGYWWLAGKWTNLLPSCVNCNQSQKYNIDGKERHLGKGSFFPLPIRDEVRQAPIPGIEASELPLLINPTEEDPNNFIYFENDMIEQYSVVKALDIDDHVKLKGESSILYYALNRPSLVESRTIEILRLTSELHGLQERIEDLLETENFTARKKCALRINRSLKSIFKLYLNNELPYFQAKFSYFMNWIQQFPEEIYKDKLLKHIEISIL